jgi:hypothetical protein
MPKRSRTPEDANETAHRVAQSLIRLTEDEAPAPPVKKKRKNPAAVALGRKGGLKGGKARAESIKLDVFPGNLIIRGIKKLYKPERLARLITLEDRLIPSQHPAYQLHELQLEKWEAVLLSRIDGNRTTAELLAATPQPEHQVRGFLAARAARTLPTHFVATLFVGAIIASAGGAAWVDVAGNLVGGSVLVALAYWVIYLRPQQNGAESR